MSVGNIFAWLSEMVARDGSDLYLTFGAPPIIRVVDEFIRVDYPALTDSDLTRLIGSLTNTDQITRFEKTKNFNMSLELPGVGRFRINLFMQQGHVGTVIRKIPMEVPTLQELGSPSILADLSGEKNGIILVVGATGSGKSTTLAAMINHRNELRDGHILTIEDPIEFVHPHKKCIVTQREIGRDALSFEDAQENALRQKADMILVGEIRSANVMRQALNIAETGQLALATLHANNSHQAIQRVANFFEFEEQRQILLNLSFNLRAVISQRLVRTTANKRVAAMELMLMDEQIREHVRLNEMTSLKQAISEREDKHMQTFDQDLLQKFRNGVIDDKVAVSESDDREWMQAQLAA
ncbi:PilT/PilU family type 4a pilus ATPase [Thalassospira xianhensis]|uniref:Twitching motility protein PilU n=1 Tax=Thalassospira xiamenensis TaxID=220697 RepID=A0A285TRL4_9PROT|nr:MULTISPECIES: PilT/PilU family type 4a pilus ATPase [Thalassospira]SOC25921.1 twitching motility protein PilU [Thalassospira xiamenensis]